MTSCSDCRYACVTVRFYVNETDVINIDRKAILESLYEDITFDKFDVEWLDKYNGKKLLHCKVEVINREKLRADVFWLEKNS